MKRSLKKIYITIQIVVILLFVSESIYGQSDRFSNGYFNSNLVVNPSLPNVGNEMSANLIFKSPMNNSIPGLQKNIGFVFMKPFEGGSAGGFNILKESAGILVKQYLLFSYAVDTRITEQSHIRAGISAGFREIKLDQSVVNQSYSSYFGNASDPVLLSYTNKPPSFYAGFGATFYNKNLDIQLVVPNLSYYYKKADSSFEDKPILIGVGYLIPIGSNSVLGDNSTIKLQFGYLKNLLSYQQSNTISGGATFSSSQGISFELFYNNAGTVNAGVGIDILNKYVINVNYLIGGVNSTIIYGGSGQAILGFKFKFPKIK